MHKMFLAIAAAATIAVGSLAVPQKAEARCFGCGVGAGIIGGIAAGAIIGAAIASHPGYYEYEYDGPPPRDCDGYWARRRWVDQYGDVHWSRPHWFCR
jgi:hypothetical protein